jgi:pimeloyl-ACP methyl ester carboxylesterase
VRGHEDELRLRDGRLVSLWDGGDPGGPAVVFFHGCPDSRRAAMPAHETAAELGVRLVAASRPGYSRSELPGEPGRPVSGREHLEVADDTAELMDLLGVDEFAVLGMSVGGPYAVATAARYADRVRAAGVVEAPADLPGLRPPVHRDGLDEGGQAFFASLAAASAVDAVELMRAEFEAYVAGIDPGDPDDAAVARRWTATLPATDAALVAPRGDAEVARAAREAIGRSIGYLRDAAVSFRGWEFDPREVRCPVHAWYGTGDDTYSTRNGEWYAETLGASYVELAGASHLGALLEHWPEILTALSANA